MSTAFSIKEALSFGWKTFMARPFLFVGAAIIYLVIELILGSLQNAVHPALGFAISFVAGTLIAVGYMHFFLRAHDDVASTKITSLWYPKPFWSYLGASILTSIIVVVGLVFLIVPGVILSLALSLGLFLVVDKNMMPIAALKESWKLTRGAWLSLFLFGLLLGAINLVGALLLMIGLMVTVPVSMLASVHVYRALSRRAPVVAASPAPEPAPAS